MDTYFKYIISIKFIFIFLLKMKPFFLEIFLHKSGLHSTCDLDLKNFKIVDKMVLDNPTNFTFLSACFHFCLHTFSPV